MPGFTENLIPSHKKPAELRESLAHQSSGEITARVFHVATGLLLLGVAGWFLFYLTPFNPYGFFGFLVLGTVPLWVGFFGSRKTVLQLLLFGWV